MKGDDLAEVVSLLTIIHVAEPAVPSIKLVAETLPSLASGRMSSGDCVEWRSCRSVAAPPRLRKKPRSEQSFRSSSHGPQGHDRADYCEPDPINASGASDGGAESGTARTSRPVPTLSPGTSPCSTILAVTVGVSAAVKLTHAPIEI